MRGRTPRQGLLLLGPICCHALLSTGPGHRAGTAQVLQSLDFSAGARTGVRGRHHGRSPGHPPPNYGLFWSTSESGSFQAEETSLGKPATPICAITSSKRPTRCGCTMPSMPATIAPSTMRVPSTNFSGSGFNMLQLSARRQSHSPRLPQAKSNPLTNTLSRSGYYRHPVCELKLWHNHYTTHSNLCGHCGQQCVNYCFKASPHGIACSLHLKLNSLRKGMHSAIP